MSLGRDGSIYAGGVSLDPVDVEREAQREWAKQRRQSCRGMLDGGKLHCLLHRHSH